MLSARAPLSAKNESTLVSDVRQLSLGKENTVSPQQRPLLAPLRESGGPAPLPARRRGCSDAIAPSLPPAASESELQPRLGVQNGAEDLRRGSGE